jgi:PAS domain S-box-containing protein
MTRRTNKNSENSLYRILFESCGDAILLLENGRVIESNASALALLGGEAGEVKGRTLLDF